MALNHFYEAFMPYCIELLDDNQIRILNREYIPLSSLTFSVNEDGYRYLISLIPADDLADKRLFLYNDNSAPSIGNREINQYFSELKQFISLDVTK